MTGQYFREHELNQIISNFSEITEEFDLGEITTGDDTPTTTRRYSLLIATGYLGKEILNQAPDRKKEGPTKSMFEQAVSNIDDYINDFMNYRPPKARTFKSKELNDLRTVYLEAADYLVEEKGVNFEEEDVGFLSGADETADAIKSELENLASELDNSDKNSSPASI